MTNGGINKQGAVHLWREIIKGQDGRRVWPEASREQSILEDAHVLFCFFDWPFSF